MCALVIFPISRFSAYYYDSQKNYFCHLGSSHNSLCPVWFVLVFEPKINALLSGQSRLQSMRRIQRL